MKSFFVLIYILLSSNFLKAEDWSSIYRSVNQDQLMESELILRQRRNNQEKCSFERRNRAFPEYCFVYLSQLMEGPVDFNEIKELQEEINSLCALRAGSVESLERVQKAQKSVFANDNCKKQIKSRIMDLNYMGKVSFSGSIIEKHSDHESFNSSEVIL